MSIRLLGGPTGGDGSPRVWINDHEGKYFIQGWRTDSHETIEIPHQLLGFLEPETFFGATLHDTGHGTFTLTGLPVVDPEVLATMRIPAHEAAIEAALMKARHP